MKPSFLPMTCRRCGRTIDPDPALPAKAKGPSSFVSCIYRCECGAGYSNARDPMQRTLIWSSPGRNVPPEVAAGIETVIGQAVNVINRANKLHKFCFETSEDAVTWTVFRALEAEGLLNVLRDGVPEGTAGTPTTMLWGVPLSDHPAASSVVGGLAEASAALGEGSNHRSEPDVILAWPDRLIFIEVKHLSPNDEKPDRPGFDRYLDRLDIFTAERPAIRASGRYELVRNWRIGVQMAEGLHRPFTLINLGPTRIEASAGEFAALLAQNGDRAFRFLTWEALLERAQTRKPLPEWLSDYVAMRGLSPGRLQHLI
jgi:hypothetical protein